KRRQPGYEHAGDETTPNVELADENSPGEDLAQQDPGIGRIERQRINIGAEQHLCRALDDEGGANRRHEKRQLTLVEQWAEHVALDEPGRYRHDGTCKQERADDCDLERKTVWNEQIE